MSVNTGYKLLEENATKTLPPADILLADFKPFGNNWQLERGEKIKRWPNGEPYYVIDGSTHKPYLNQSDTNIRLKCILLSVFGTPIQIVKFGFKCLKEHAWTIVTFGFSQQGSCDVKGAATDFAKTVTRVALFPITLVGLQCAAMYGIAKPLDGRKLYASIERFGLGDSRLAPCFQPKPTEHLLGGDMNNKGSW